MLVYIGGEDQVTKLIAKKIVSSILPNANIEFEDVSPRDYGAKALSKIDQMVKLGETYPTICVFDSDANCSVTLLKEHTTNGWKSRRCAINIAVDEAESWLLADREGFSRFFGIDIENIPKLSDGQTEISSLIPYKTSLYILQKLIPLSKNKLYSQELACIERNKKPTNYNTYFQAFINTAWDINNARNNSAILNRAIVRCTAALT